LSFASSWSALRTWLASVCEQRGAGRAGLQQFRQFPADARRQRLVPADCASICRRSAH
jgi:hypothetical protein